MNSFFVLFFPDTLFELDCVLNISRIGESIYSQESQIDFASVLVMLSSGLNVF